MRHEHDRFAQGPASRACARMGSKNSPSSETCDARGRVSGRCRIGQETFADAPAATGLRRYRTFDLAGVGGLKFLTSNGFVLAGVVRITQLGQGVSLNSAGGAKRNHAFALAIP